LFHLWWTSRLLPHGAYRTRAFGAATAVTGSGTRMPLPTIPLPPVGALRGREFGGASRSARPGRVHSASTASVPALARRGWNSVRLSPSPPGVRTALPEFHLAALARLARGVAPMSPPWLLESGSRRRAGRSSLSSSRRLVTGWQSSRLVVLACQDMTPAMTGHQGGFSNPLCPGSLGLSAVPRLEL